MLILRFKSELQKTFNPYLNINNSNSSEALLLTNYSNYNYSLLITSHPQLTDHNYQETHHHYEAHDHNHNHNYHHTAQHSLQLWRRGPS